jgi:hypothetical protein
MPCNLPDLSSLLAQLHPLILIVFQLQYQTLIFFLEAVCVDVSGVVYCKPTGFDWLCCSPGSRSKIWFPKLLRETDVSAQAFYPHYSFEAVKCVRFSRVVMVLLS